METFASITTLPRVVPLDPTKHVNFVPGMVLGADDFAQEFAWVSGRDHWMLRDLAGHGTVWGLHVTVDEGRVTVEPGVAVTPCGRLICVTPAQCAELDAWLQAHEQELRGRFGEELGDEVELWLVACYRECLTDPVPIPGEPCRSEDDLMAPGRVADDFKLELRLDPPEQHDEDATVAFGRWLREVEVVESGGAEIGPFLAALRALAPEAPETTGAAEEPGEPAPPPITAVSPPADLTIDRADAPEFLRAALRVWTTELRPRLRRPGPGAAEDCGCGCGGDCGCTDVRAGLDAACEDAVVLARIDVPLAWPVGAPVEVDDAGATVDDDARPYVVHTRLLQELLLGGHPLGAAAPPAPGPAPEPEPTDEPVVGPPPVPAVVAAGAIAGDPFGSEVWHGELDVKPVDDGDDPANRLYQVRFAQEDGHRYALRGTAVVRDLVKDAPVTVDLVHDDDGGGGFLVRVRAAGEVTATPDVVIEIADYGAA